MTKKILVVDDEPDILKVLKARLEKSGYTVVTAADEETCFARAVGEKPDLILLDAIMPGMGGFGICKKLKKDAKTKDIPVIIVTALFGKSAADRGLESGAAYLISKPFDAKNLLWEIEDALKNKK